MKYKVIRFKTLKIALQELQPFILNGEHITTGRPFDNFGRLRSRELLANWLLCVVANAAVGIDCFTFTSDPLGGDGIIYNTSTEESWQTEHVMVTGVSRKALAIEDRILSAVTLKQEKGGRSYAKGKTLIVMLNSGAAKWEPNKIADKLPQELYFDAVWVVGLQEIKDANYIYNVSRLDRSRGNAPVWRVQIGRDFEHWIVSAIQ